MNTDILHIDIETYSSVDITKAGAYKYVESSDFEILLVAYAYGNGDIQLIALARGESIPAQLRDDLYNPEIKKYAHNANFERICLSKHFQRPTPVDQWHCTAILASTCGYPASLAKLTVALNLGVYGKLRTGKALIKFFCMPQKPTKKKPNLRNFPNDDIEAWDEFGRYCMNDVKAERRVHQLLAPFEADQTESERQLYLLDQKINDTGVLVDMVFAQKAAAMHKLHKQDILQQIKDITQLENPNSPAQLKAWLSESMGTKITTLDKNKIGPLVKKAGVGLAGQVLKLRSMASKTSVKKYSAMLQSAGNDNRVRGTLQFQGAGRTGRWAGRITQVHNLPRNYIEPLDFFRSLVRNGDIDSIKLFNNDVSSILSQLIRTALIAPEGKTFGVADFSAIEARVIAWVSGEQWRLDVFNTHGKIYEASASAMFNVPIEQITKGSSLRDRGKVAELALGFQGGHKAIDRMGGSKMGLTVPEMKHIVDVWRKKNKKVVSMWHDVNKLAIVAIKSGKKVNYRKGIYFECKHGNLLINLPSGRKLAYANARLGRSKFDSDMILFDGVDQTRGTFREQDTYGGKLTENIVQAIARDLLAYSMLNVDKAGYKIVMHVHDELVSELDEQTQDEDLNNMCAIMGQGPAWAKGLPLNAEGYLSKYYKKD